MDNFTLLGSHTISGFSLGTWYTLGLRANGSSISVEVNGSTMIGPVTDTAFTSGDAGVWSYAPGSAGSHRFDNFSITVLSGGFTDASKVRAMPLLRANQQSGSTCVTGQAASIQNDLAIQLQFQNNTELNRRLYSLTIQWPASSSHTLDSVSWLVPSHMVWQAVGGVNSSPYTISPSRNSHGLLEA